ncbi:MAG: hypothetical protein ACRECH_05510 [Nitrososphaerales archaeon]
MSDPIKIYIEPSYKLHVGYHLNELVPFPPPGYEFVTGSQLYFTV